VSYLLDTDVVSELTRRRPDRRVLRWFEATAEESLHLSVLSLGELRGGVETQRDPRRREKLRVFLERDLPGRFEDRLLPLAKNVLHGEEPARPGHSVPARPSRLAFLRSRVASTSRWARAPGRSPSSTRTSSTTR